MLNRIMLACFTYRKSGSNKDKMCGSHCSINFFKLMCRPLKKKNSFIYVILNESSDSYVKTQTNKKHSTHAVAVKTAAGMLNCCEDDKLHKLES